MKYIVFIIVAILAWACDNQTTRYQSPADDLFGPDEDSLLAEESPDTDTEGDKWWEDAPNTLPDTTVATCGNGVIDEGEECDGAKRSVDDCGNIDPELYLKGPAAAVCNSKWCRWNRQTCVSALKDFDCPLGYAGEDCKKCAPNYQDYDLDGYCYGSCMGGSESIEYTAFFNHIEMAWVECGEHGSCEYYEGKPVCSCMEGWKRDENGSCTISE